MLNVLFPEIRWDEIKCVGFDLDGTLYDEFVFIRQVYRAILLEHVGFFERFDAPYQYMLDRWLEKGSSFNHIFEEVFEKFSTGRCVKANFIRRALDIYRNFEPVLTLPPRNRYLLEMFKGKFEVFLISDGCPSLQKNKFFALKLDTVFSPGQTIFTGEMGTEFHKPNPSCFERLGLTAPPSGVLYFGDREIDREFTRNLGIHFQPVYNMVPR